VRARLELAAALQRLLGDLERGGVLLDGQGGRLPLLALDHHPAIAGLGEDGLRRPQLRQRVIRTAEPDQRGGPAEPEPGLLHAAVLTAQQPVDDLQRLLVGARPQQQLDVLLTARRARRRRLRRAGQEVLERLAGPLGDELQRLRRRPRTADLDQVDGRAAPVFSPHLRHGKSGLAASLPNRPRAQVYTTLDRTLRLLHTRV
jgi:hypothetical protein